MPDSRALSVPPLTILLLGGVASGKSTIASLLEKRGAVVLDADRLAHAALEEPDVRAEVVARFGSGVIDEQGRVDRKRLGEVVFADPERLRTLEGIVHPRVTARIADRVLALATSPGEARNVAVLDVPLASEAGMLAVADLRLFVDAGEDTRRARAREKRSWAPGELERREKRQLGVEEKRAKADFVVRNDGDLAEAERDVERFWSDVVRPLLWMGNEDERKQRTR